MDTSDEYIKMSNYPEIQDDKKYNDGDFFYRAGDIYVCGKWEAGAIIQYQDPIFEIFDGGYEYDKIEFYDVDDAVWLPRQDQLQEMIKTPELEDPFCMCVAFYKWWSEAKANWDNDPDNGYSTMEQLWLGYVMQQLHGKKWNGEEWIK